MVQEKPTKRKISVCMCECVFVYGWNNTLDWITIAAGQYISFLFSFVIFFVFVAVVNGIHTYTKYCEIKKNVNLTKNNWGPFNKRYIIIHVQIIWKSCNIFFYFFLFFSGEYYIHTWFTWIYIQTNTITVHILTCTHMFVFARCVCVYVYVRVYCFARNKWWYRLKKTTKANFEMRSRFATCCQT